MNRNTLAEHSPLQSVPRQDYLQQIVSAMNKIRAKLPYIDQYSPDKHFQYLCRLSSNKQKASQPTLEQLIPFTKQYKSQHLQKYLGTALHTLNNNTKYLAFGPSSSNDRDEGLKFAGYVRLITCIPLGRNDVKGSQVNRTLFKRITLQRQLLQGYRCGSGHWKYNKQPMYTTADSIIGFLIFMQCLKIKQQTSLLAEKTGRTMQSTNKTSGYGRGLLMLDTPKDRNEQHPQITIDDTIRKPIFNFLSPKSTHSAITVENSRPRAKPRIPFDKTRRTAATEHTPHPSLPSLNTFYSPDRQRYNNPEHDYQEGEGGFLKGFSSEKNVWKNLHQRNMEYRTFLTKSGVENNSAFLEEENQQDRMFYLKKQQNQRYKGMLINKINPNHYMFK